MVNFYYDLVRFHYDVVNVYYDVTVVRFHYDVVNFYYDVAVRFHYDVMNFYYDVVNILRRSDISLRRHENFQTLVRYRRALHPILLANLNQKQ